jgi:hypothetical protein
LERVKKQLTCVVAGSLMGILAGFLSLEMFVVFDEERRSQDRARELATGIYTFSSRY